METLIEILKWDPAQALREFVFGYPIIGPLVGAIFITISFFILFLLLHEISIQSIIQDKKKEQKDN